MGLRLYTAPTVEPVTLAQAKLWLKVETGDTTDDTLITGLISAVRQMLEQKTGRALLGQTWQLTLDAFPDAIELTRVPVLSVTHLKFKDAAGVQQTLAPEDYTVDTERDDGWAYIVPAYGKAWPETIADINAVEVRWQAGYHATDPAKVPEALQTWLQLMLGAAYENREAVEQGAEIRTMPFVDRLLDRYTLPRL